MLKFKDAAVLVATSGTLAVAKYNSFCVSDRNGYRPSWLMLRAV